MSSAAVTPRRGRPPNPQIRAKILGAALELFAEKGYDATSVNQVVIRAGVTKGALYHYFAAKEDLLYEIYRGLLDQQLADLERISVEEPDPSRALSAVIHDLVVTTITHRREVIVFSRESARLSTERWRALQRDWRRYQDIVRRVIRDAQRQGTFSAAASPELASWMIFGFTTSLPTWYRPDGPKSPADIAADASGFVLAALRSHSTEGNERP
jgi:AcrR family transcriptional regulator